MTWHFDDLRPGPNDYGFTLIELIVVLLIVALLSSMVGPEIFKQINKVEISAEESQLESVIETIQNTAFARETPYSLILKDHGLTVMDETRVTMFKTEFEHLVFQERVLYFNANGFVDKSNIRYLANNREKTFVFEQ